MAKAKNWNAPENWLGWLRVLQKEERSHLAPLAKLTPLAVLTGTDLRTLHAIAAVWNAYGREGDGPLVVAMLLDRLQEKCWPFARELIAQQLEWTDRDPLWEQVMRERELLKLATPLREVSRG